MPLNVPGVRIPGTAMPTLGFVSERWRSVIGRKERGTRDIQFPMTAVLTMRVKSVFWFAAVLFTRRAVV